MPIEAVSPSSGVYAAGAPRDPKQTMDSEVFMHLLVTQLRNQDPQLTHGHQSNDFPNHGTGHDGAADHHGRAGRGELLPADEDLRRSPDRPDR